MTESKAKYIVYIFFSSTTKCIKQSSQCVVLSLLEIFFFLVCIRTHMFYYYYLSKMSWGDFFPYFSASSLCSPSFRLFLFLFWFWHISSHIQCLSEKRKRLAHDTLRHEPWHPMTKKKRKKKMKWTWLSHSKHSTRNTRTTFTVEIVFLFFFFIGGCFLSNHTYFDGFYFAI